MGCDWRLLQTFRRAMLPEESSETSVTYRITARGESSLTNVAGCLHQNVLYQTNLLPSYTAAFIWNTWACDVYLA